MGADNDEEALLRSVALQNANSILLTRLRAEQELLQAKEALERRTEELARSLAMARATLESTTDAILVTNARGAVTDFNQKFVDLWQIPSAVMETRQHRELLEITSRRFKDAEKFCARIDEIYRTSPSESYDLLEPLDGRVIERFTKIQSMEARNFGRVWSFRDITDRKRVETELQEVDRKKDEFLAILAHELRNPLAPIRNGLSILRLASNNPVIAENARSMMDRALNQMVRLVDDLLEVNRITTGKLELRKERVELASVVQCAVETCRALIDDQSQELIVTLPTAPVMLDVDPTRLTQVFSNLLNNAAKFSEPCGTIRLAAACEPNEVIVRVKDNGIGIPASQLAHIFEMFTQVDTTLEKARGGLGIGLSLVKALVEAHGGSVDAQSEGPGNGSEFVVRLPTVLSELATETDAVIDRGKEMTGSAKLRVLIVDDNRLSCDSAAILLRLNGNEVATAYDGMEGMKIASTFRPDAILLDIGMPKLNGYETAQRIREQSWGQSVFLIAVTGFGQAEDRRRTLAAGFNYHLVKPIVFAELEKLLAEIEARLADATK